MEDPMTEPRPPRSRASTQPRRLSSSETVMSRRRTRRGGYLPGRAGQPRAQRCHPRAVRGGPRRGGVCRSPGRPVQGRSVSVQGSRRHLCGSADDLGMRLLKEANFRAPMDSYLAERFRAAGFVVSARRTLPSSASCRRASPWPTERPAIRGTQSTHPAARPAGRVPRWRPEWCRSPTPTTAAAQSESRLPSTAWSG